MTYEIPLKGVAITIGLLASAWGLIGLLLSERGQSWMKGLARNYIVGVVLMVIAIVWACWLTSFVDLGEYSGIRHWMILAMIILGVATIVFLPDLLTARALGVLLLLAAEVLLSAAFPVELKSRYVITLLAYFWAITGMIFVALPYSLRDLLFWSYATEKRLRLLSSVKLGLGLVILALGIFIY